MNLKYFVTDYLWKHFFDSPDPFKLNSFGDFGNSKALSAILFKH